MRARRDRKRGPLKVQAVYSIQTLARVAGVTHQLLGRLLRAADVNMLTAGRSILVPLTEIEAKIPPLWRSIVKVERLRADAQRAEGQAEKPE
jgi:hypothetical protein